MSLKLKPTFNQLVSNINNGIATRSMHVKVPYCIFNFKILECLSRLGYIESFKSIQSNNFTHFLVIFKFDVNGRQCLQRLRILKINDRQLCLRYKLVKNLKKGDKIFKGSWLVSTTHSILTDDEALARDIHGLRFLLVT